MSVPDPKAIVSDLRRTASILIGPDRTGLVPASSTLARRSLAWTAIIVVYAIGWGLSTAPAIAIALGYDYQPGTLTDARAWKAIALKVFISGLAAFVIITVRKRARAPRTRVPFSRSVKAYFAAVVAIMIGFTVSGLLAQISGTELLAYPSPQYGSPLAQVLAAVVGILAGPSEELALMAMVVTVLRASGYSWVVVCVTAVVVRVPFHLYYGWGAIGLSAWAVLIVLLYRRTAAITAIILAHATFNGLEDLGDIGQAIKVIWVVTAWLVALITMARLLDRHRRTQSATSTSDSKA